jgi:hypothetical protein
MSSLFNCLKVARLLKRVVHRNVVHRDIANICVFSKIFLTMDASFAHEDREKKYTIFLIIRPLFELFGRIVLLTYSRNIWPGAGILAGCLWDCRKRPQIRW